MTPKDMQFKCIDMHHNASLHPPFSFLVVGNYLSAQKFRQPEPQTP